MGDGVILYVGGFELPDKNAAAHRVLSNAKILKELGKKIVFAGVDKTLKSGSNVLSTFTDVQGFDTYFVPYPNGTKEFAKNMVDIKQYIKICETLKNVEMIICYNFPSIALNKLRKYCHKNGMKCIADVTEWYSGAGRNLPVKIVKGFDTWYRMKVVQKKLDGLIVISRYLEKYYKNCRNTVYVPTLVDSNEEKWQVEYQKSDSVLKLVYAGTPGRKDRIDKLIEALQFVKRDCFLDVIGITKEQYLDMYPKHKDFLNGCKSISFHGRLSHLEALDYVKHANYSCFFREDNRVSKAGFPTKFAEAITCGTPVITNKTSNLDEYVHNSKNGILLDSIQVEKIVSVLQNAPLIFEVEKDIFDYRNYLPTIEKMLSN
jgi:glycosyltransferase involved in cell wall biosynthesis